MSGADNLVIEISYSTGTGNLTIEKFRGQRFSDAFATGSTQDVFYYFALNEDVDDEWEYGTGHCPATGTLVRDTVLGSSNSGSAVNFSAGRKRITNAFPADYYASAASLASYYTSAQTDSAIAAYAQPLNANLTSWAAISRASGFDTFVAAPSSANLRSLVTDETGTGALVFATSPTLTTSALLSSGFVFSWNAGDVTLTHLSNALKLEGGHLLIGQSSDSVYKLDVVSTADTAAVRAQSSGLVAGYWTTQTGTGTQETFSFNQLNISSDDIVAGTVDPTVGFVNGLKVDHYFGGSNAKGGRNAIFGKLRHTTATSASNTYKYYTGMFGWGEAQANDGGGSGTELGVMYGVGALSYLQSGATYWLAAIGCEATAGIATGASAKYRIPLVVNGLGGAAVKGSSVDALIAICNQPSGAKFDTGILFTQLGSGTDPIATTGSLVSTSGGATVLHGIDLSGYTFNGGAYKSNGFSVDGLGNIVGKSYLPNADDGGAVGSASYKISDIFLAPGAEIDFNAGDVKLAHSSDTLTLTGGHLVFTPPADATQGTATTYPIRIKNSANSSVYLTLGYDGTYSVIHSWNSAKLAINPQGNPIEVQNAVSLTGGGSTTMYISLSSSILGIYAGSGAPSISAAKGSIYLRSDGSSTSTRLYVNTNGSTTWTNVTTAA